jgi:hypothetical protein
MTPKATIILRCPKCDWSFEAERGDKLHPLCITEKPLESDVTEDAITRVYDCRNPNCMNPITVYCNKPKMSVDVA